MGIDVLVVGSVNEDIVVSVERLPGPGETLLASEFALSCGGKGANQAVAAARDGARVALAGAVGDDDAGERQAAALDGAGVDTRWVRRLTGVPTGTAFIQVDSRGENTIVVVQGANAHVALPVGDAEPQVVVTQNEIPPAAQQEAVALAARTGARLVINAAPAPESPPPWYGIADPLVVNEHEAAQLATSDETGAGLLRRLRERTGARSVVMTLGERGALVDDGIEVHAIPPVAVEQAARLARGDGVVAAASAANRCAAKAVTWPGARPPVG